VSQLYKRPLQLKCQVARAFSICAQMLCNCFHFHLYTKLTNGNSGKSRGVACHSTLINDELQSRPAHLWLRLLFSITHDHSSLPPVLLLNSIDLTSYPLLPPFICAALPGPIFFITAIPRDGKYCIRYPAAHRPKAMSMYCCFSIHKTVTKSHPVAIPGSVQPVKLCVQESNARIPVKYMVLQCSRMC